MTQPKGMSDDEFKKRKSEYDRKYRRRNLTKKLAYYANWLAQNMETKLEVDRNYRLQHREELRRKAHDYYHQLSSDEKERHLQRRRKYGKEYRSKNKSKHNAYNREFLRKNPAKRRAYDLTRRARELNAIGKFTDNDIAHQWELQNGRCYYCGHELGKYHVDHLIPLSRNGTNNPDNIVLACPHCNQSKHNKLPEEWKNEWTNSTRLAKDWGMD